MNRFAILLLIVLAAIHVGCAGHNNLSEAPEAVETQGFAGIPEPSEIVREASVAGIARIRQGNEYIPLSNHNTSNGGFDTENFEPTTVPTDTDLENAAFAVYGFPLDDYAGAPEITIRWVGTPPPDENIWVGLPNYDVDGWSWMAYPASGYIEYDSAGPHFNGDGDLMVALVLTGDTTYRFDYLRIGPDVAPVAGLEADVTRGNAALKVNFDASLSFDPDGSIDKYELDPLGDGSWYDNGSDRFFPEFTYGTPGGYTAALRVTDSEMNTATTELFIGVGWQHTWGGAGYENGSSIAVDTDGNMHVLGLTTSFGEGANEFLLLKYDTGGDIAWQKTFGDATGNTPEGIGLDHLGNIYVAGSDLDNGDFSEDPIIASFTSAGALRWQKVWDHAGSSSAVDLVVDSLGDVYVLCTYSQPFPDTTALVLLKYSGETGALIFQRLWNEAERVVPKSMAIDSSNNLYFGVSSNLYSVGNLVDNPVLVSFDSDGDGRFIRQYAIEDETGLVDVSVANDKVYMINLSVVVQADTAGNLELERNILALDEDYTLYSVQGKPDGGCFLVAGYDRPAPDFFTEALLIELDSAGLIVFSKSFGQANQHDQLGQPVLGADGGLYLAGRAINNDGAWSGHLTASGDISVPWNTHTGTVFNAMGVSNPWGGVLSDVPGGAETIDTGGGGSDAQAMRYFP